MKDINVTIQIKKEDLKEKLDLKDGAPGSPGPKGDSYILTEADKAEIASKIKPKTVDKVVEIRTETVVKPIYSNELTERTRKEVGSLIKKNLKDMSWNDLKDTETLFTRIKGFISAKTYSLSELDDVDLSALTKNTKGKYVLGSGSGGGTGAMTWSDYALKWTSAPTLYDTQPTYSVYEYTYGTTKYYRKVLNTYDPSQDNFYTNNTLSILVASRALSI